MHLHDEHMRNSDVKIYVSMRFDELEYDDDRKVCDARTFSNCRLAISTGPIAASPENYMLRLKLETGLSVFADPETGAHAGNYIRGRYFTLPEDFARAISWIRKRLAECGAYHQDCAATEDREMPDNFVGMGLFDVEQEQTDSLWCLRLIRDRGLMLHLDQDGKCHRLGKFVVMDQAFFEDEPERRVSLV
ncbi:uncharacterized protein Z518_01506 [Rhinocladiella mackenziei CBS 650.93]|uniref:Rhinocladiella mackenziei CBS 650.93 unplaced genomic scaffold supercont1.1, whole genome shotgun sequence n=1 Tax=Rhinocladiella mackenziei CBS 650.93 TaxID=1442369 RepID=A0A0D2IWQ4_9EURO|nr:uncharacterized protein Z518_01506 [Rhinocladiella mackenziei CBS 650.93]KIX10424.1 hypothetical protein Z518_01506 [Rhinocladiella mackenziei CBS 650.93]